jgi:hypothetical protein
VDDVDELVARPIPAGLECRDPIAKVLLVAVLRAENEFAHARVKPVRADDEVETAFTATLEFDLHFVVRRLKAGDTVREDDLARLANPIVDELREVAAFERHISSAGQLAEPLHAKSR